MMRHAWKGFQMPNLIVAAGYRNCSWGANEVQPRACAPYFGGTFTTAPLGATIVDAADTLYLMGLREEYEQARAWIRDEFDIRKQKGQLVFETTIRLLGGLLSLHTLTNESFYLEKALAVGNHMLPHFAHRIFQSSKLSEFGSLHLEFIQLSRASGRKIFEIKARRIRDVMAEAKTWDGLFASEYSESGEMLDSRFTVAGDADSFYEYLLKSWLQSNRTDYQARKMHRSASAAIKKRHSKGNKKGSRLVFQSESGLTYIGQVKSGTNVTEMQHLTCFIVGLFVLEAQYNNTIKLAEELARTCHESYIRAPTHLGPEVFRFGDGYEAVNNSPVGNYNILRPEVIEAFFYLWRFTGKEMYREWVWDAVLAIDKHCRQPFGFAGLKNVYNVSEGIKDNQETFFLAETLKYAFLTFAPSSVLSFDHWVFNTEAHPLPILRS